MTNNFTHLNLRFDIVDLRNHELQLRGVKRNENPGPSESVIKTLLNYSKALTVLSDKHTGNVHPILLN